MSIENSTLAHFRQFSHFRHSFNYNIFPDKQIMQNKANLTEAQININTIVTMRYANLNSSSGQKTNPIQTQFKANKAKNKPNLSQNKANSNPICRKGEINAMFAFTKDYEENGAMGHEKTNPIKSKEPIMNDMSLFENFSSGYQPVPAPNFEPDKIIITKGSYQTKQQRNLTKAICSAYPKAGIIEKLDLPHNRVQLNSPDPLELHYAGKKTLVLGLHKSALRYSDEDENTCPNYWHFSPYGFCPYDCRYCYLAGTPGVKYSPTVKIFLNLPEILNQITRVASQLNTPTAFYLGKLQDGLALDPLTGYSRVIIPFFARQRYARLILLTKSFNVENLLDIDHKQNTILSWSLNPSEVSSAFERNVPSPVERINALQKCAEAGYPVRAVIMPIIPIEGWQKIYTSFIGNLLESTPLKRITLGQICSYSAALKLTERKLGKNNPISNRLEKVKSNDGRVRFPLKLRIDIYRYLIDKIKKLQPELHIGLCMEEYQTFKALNIESAVGCCNCVI